jgi:hypothetical protein
VEEILSEHDTGHENGLLASGSRTSEIISTSVTGWFSGHNAARVKRFALNSLSRLRAYDKCQEH